MSIQELATRENSMRWLKDGPTERNAVVWSRAADGSVVLDYEGAVSLKMIGGIFGSLGSMIAFVLFGAYVTNNSSQHSLPPGLATSVALSLTALLGGVALFSYGWVLHRVRADMHLPPPLRFSTGDGGRTVTAYGSTTTPYSRCYLIASPERSLLAVTPSAQRARTLFYMHCLAMTDHGPEHLLTFIYRSHYQMRELRAANDEAGLNIEFSHVSPEEAACSSTVRRLERSGKFRWRLFTKRTR